jgi:hypothetical protein
MKGRKKERKKERRRERKGGEKMNTGGREGISG